MDRRSFYNVWHPEMGAEYFYRIIIFRIRTDAPGREVHGQISVSLSSTALYFFINDKHYILCKNLLCKKYLPLPFLRCITCIDRTHSRKTKATALLCLSKTKIQPSRFSDSNLLALNSLAVVVPSQHLLYHHTREIVAIHALYEQGALLLLLDPEDVWLNAHLIPRIGQARTVVGLCKPQDRRVRAHSGPRRLCHKVISPGRIQCTSVCAPPSGELGPGRCRNYGAEKKVRCPLCFERSPGT